MHGSRGRSADVVVALGAALVALGMVARITSPADAFVAFAPSSSPTIAASTILPPPRPLPANLACHAIDRADCLAIIRVAMASLAEDIRDPISATATSSLLCDSTIDCSAVDLRTWIPRGSVVLSFGAEGPDAWLNVADHPSAGGHAAVAEAWTVRWARFVFPSPLPSAAPSP